MPKRHGLKLMSNEQVDAERLLHWGRLADWMLDQCHFVHHSDQWTEVPSKSPPESVILTDVYPQAGPKKVMEQMAGRVHSVVHKRYEEEHAPKRK